MNEQTQQQRAPAPALVHVTRPGARCVVCGWYLVPPTEARQLAHGLAHVACAEGEHASRGGA